MLDSTPPVIHNCPDPIAVIAEPIQTYAVVTWKEPNSAHDNRDGFIRQVSELIIIDQSYLTEDSTTPAFILPKCIPRTFCYGCTKCEKGCPLFGL